MSSAHSTALAPVVDPSSLPDDQFRELRSVAAQITKSHRNVDQAYVLGVWHASRAGEKLLFVKDSLPHGLWKKWLAEHLLEISVRTCQRYMEVAEQLRQLPDYPAVEPDSEPSKVERATQLALLSANRLVSIREALAFGKPQPQLQSPSAPALQSRSSAESAPPTPRDDDHWQTPSDIVDASIELFGVIDLDPCGVDAPALHLPATRTLTAADDSLAPGTAWNGRLIVHPPGSRMASFVERAAGAIASGEAEEALLVLPADTDASHMAVLQPYARGFLHCRPTFSLPSGELTQPHRPYMIVFVTRDDARIDDFAAAFGHLCDVYRAFRF